MDAKTHPYISTGLKKNKFGMPRLEIIQAVKEIQKLNGIELSGISIHIGSQLLSLSSLSDAFARLRTLIDELTPLLKTPLQFVDLGGGIGISYKNEKAPTLEAYSKLILKYFGKSPSGGTPLKILIEPGRRISGNSGIILTEVLYRKEKKGKDFLIVDAAMNDLMRPALYESYHEITPVTHRLTKGRKKKVDIVGPICESSDCLGSDRLVSTQLQQGDLLAILSAGAYGFSMSSNYNSRPRAAEVLVKGDQFIEVRQRETYEDLIRHELTISNSIET